MTVSDLKTLLVSADPNIQRYDHDGSGSAAYTIWTETGRVNLFGDGAEEGSIRFTVDRFTKEEGDAVAEALLTTLEGREDITVNYSVDYERDTGYIHHIFDCEAI